LELTRTRVVTGVAAGVLIFGALVWWIFSWGDDSQQFGIPGERERIVIEVLNTTQVDGLARTMTRRIRRTGIDVVHYRSSGERLDSTLILVRRGDSSFVGRIRAAIGGGRVVMEPDARLLVDASVLLGLDVAPKSDIEP
jgi:hypothetical protein